MRYLVGALLALFLIGCYNPMNEIMQDNLYLEKTPFSDSNAPYIGEWTAALPLGLISICIKADGQVLMCASNSYFGTCRGIIYKENNELFMILEGGANYKIKSVTKDAIITEYLREEHKFVAGRIPDTCKQPFANFMNE